MPGGTDVEIAGAGYALVAGGYARRQQGSFQRRSGRIDLAGFGGGQRQPFQPAAADGASAGRGWDAVGTVAVYGGQGVEPWPNVAPHADALVGPPTTGQRAHGIVVGDRVYVGVGSRLLRTAPLTEPVWANLTQVATFAGLTISDVARYKDDVMVFFGPGAGASMRLYRTATATIVDPWVTGEAGSVGVGYKGQLLFAPTGAGLRERVRLSLDRYDAAILFRNRNADGPVVRIGAFGGKVAIASRAGLSLFAGEWDPGSATPAVTANWTGDLEPVFAHGVWTAEDDFVFLQGHLGRLYTWVAGRVVAWDPANPGAGWRQTGPEGRACYGAAVAGGYLVVALQPRDGGSELWASDGAGWFRIARHEPGGDVLCWPIAVAGVGDRDLLVFRSGQPTYNLYRLVWRANGLHTYGPSGEWRTSLLDAGEPATAKAWTAIGARFAAPEARGNAASTDPVTIALDWSSDAGATWTEAAILTTSGTPARQYALLATPTAGDGRAPVGRSLQLRVRWSGVLDWAPVLTGLWAEWAIDDAPAPRRRWELKVAARDGQVRRDGGREARSGRQLAADLWAAWQTGTPVPFADVDYEAAPVTRTVRIVAIAEEIPKPADAARWGESVVSLTLVET